MELPGAYGPIPEFCMRRPRTQVLNGRQVRANWFFIAFLPESMPEGDIRGRCIIFLLSRTVILPRRIYFSRWWRGGHAMTRASTPQVPH